jgi:hypothetical protein
MVNGEQNATKLNRITKAGNKIILQTGNKANAEG